MAKVKLELKLPRLNKAIPRLSVEGARKVLLTKFEVNVADAALIKDTDNKHIEAKDMTFNLSKKFLTHEIASSNYLFLN
mgnify:CR=1 FL=1